MNVISSRNWRISTHSPTTTTSGLYKLTSLVASWCSNKVIISLDYWETSYATTPVHPALQGTACLKVWKYTFPIRPGNLKCIDFRHVLSNQYVSINFLVVLFAGSYTNLSTNSPANQLFEYMLNHDTLYGMRAVRMVPYTDDDSEAVSYSPVFLAVQR